VLGIALTVALGVAGCGGGGSSTGSTHPQPGQLREAFLHSELPALEKEGVPQAKIACVERTIEDVSEKVIAEWVIKPAPATPAHKTAAERLGPLGKGCF
jgi:hypothetical protein